MTIFSAAVEEEEEDEMEMATGSKRKISSAIDRQKKKMNTISKNGNFGEEEEELTGGRISASIDPDVLDCPICFEPLRPPLFQCQNGHVACSSCCTKIHNICPSCKLTTNYSRCLTLEKVIESIKLPCSYANGGCKEKLSYAERLNHEGSCIYIPCFCPMPSCTFSGSTQLLSTHFADCHNDSITEIRYNVSVLYLLDFSLPFHVFRADAGELFLLLNETGRLDAGNALSMTCICPQSLDDEIKYKLKVAGQKNSLQMNALMTNVRKWNGSYPQDVYLLVPQDFQVSRDRILVKVHIQKQFP